MKRRARLWLISTLAGLLVASGVFNIVWFMKQKPGLNTAVKMWVMLAVHTLCGGPILRSYTAMHNEGK